MTWTTQHTTTCGPFTLTAWQDDVDGRYHWRALNDGIECFGGVALSLAAAQHDAEHTAREQLS